MRRTRNPQSRLAAGSGHLLRGRGRYDYVEYYRSAYRYWYEPGHRSRNPGLRLVLKQKK